MARAPLHNPMAARPAPVAVQPPPAAPSAPATQGTTPGYSGAHGAALDFNAPGFGGVNVQPRVNIKPYEEGKDHWSVPEDTDWYLVKIPNPDDVPKVAAFADTTEKSVIKFLCKRYEEIKDEKAYKSREKCAAIDERNKKVYRANAELCARLTENVLRPLYHKAITVPHYIEYEKEASERWARHCAQPEVRLEKAIKYLKKHHRKVATVDYKIKDAVTLCDELAFQDIINARIAEKNGEIPVRIVGQRSGKWNGVDETDSNGRYIRWYRKPGFSFTRPDLVDFEICAKPAVVVSDA